MFTHLCDPIRHCMAAMGGVEGALGCPQDSESVFPDFTTPRTGRAKLGKPCSTQGPVAQPGREALLHPLELFTCRALLQHLEVRTPGSSAGAFCTTKPWAAPLSCSHSPIINSFSGPTGFTCYHIPKKGRRSTQRRGNFSLSAPKAAACPKPLRN